MFLEARVNVIRTICGWHLLRAALDVAGKLPANMGRCYGGELNQKLTNSGMINTVRGRVTESATKTSAVTYMVVAEVYAAAVADTIICVYTLTAVDRGCGIRHQQRGQLTNCLVEP